MKKLILILASLTACASLIASNVTLTWDFNAPEENITSYKLYEIIDGTNVIKYVIPGTNNIITLTDVTPGKHEYFVTASNMWGESDPSNTVTTPAPATSPKAVKITIIVTVE